MTDQEAWKQIAKDSLLVCGVCTVLNGLWDEGRISDAQARRMMRQLKQYAPKYGGDTTQDFYWRIWTITPRKRFCLAMSRKRKL